MDIDSARRHSRDFPEINMSNFDADDVAALNNWGIQAVQLLDDLTDACERQFCALESIRDRANEVL